MINFLYKLFRIFFFPIIYIADFFQNNFTSYFTPMNMGPVSKDSYSMFIKKKISEKNFILDYGSGAGFFCRLFDPNKYLGVEINKNFVLAAKKKYKNYRFRLLKNDYLKKYEKKISLIFINNVLHHLTDEQIRETFNFFRKKLNPNVKIFIIEPLFPKKIFALEFFMKVLDIGNNIKTKQNYINLFKKNFIVKKYSIKKVGIGTVLVIEGELGKKNKLLS